MSYLRFVLVAKMTKKKEGRKKRMISLHFYPPHPSRGLLGKRSGLLLVLGLPATGHSPPLLTHIALFLLAPRTVGLCSGTPAWPGPRAASPARLSPANPPVPITSCSAFQLAEKSRGLRGGAAAMAGPFGAAAASPGPRSAFLLLLLLLRAPALGPGSSGLRFAIRPGRAAGEAVTGRGFPLHRPARERAPALGFRPRDLPRGLCGGAPRCRGRAAGA